MSDSSRQQQVQSTLHSLIERFQAGTVSEVMKLTLVPRHHAGFRLAP